MILKSKTRLIETKNQKCKKIALKMSRDMAEFFKIPIISTSKKQVLEKIIDFIGSEAKGKMVFTPNAEFLVAAYSDPRFRKVLKQADINVPDGFGLILLSKFKGKKIKERISGADLVENLMNIANKKNWRVGIVGARQGDVNQKKQLIKRLEEKYPKVTLVDLDNLKSQVSSLKFQVVFACQGIKKQEEWILKNRQKIRANVFMGVGGSLDFLTGFQSRAPLWIRKIGLEWLWRGLTKPGHWKRVFAAVIVFPWLVIREKFEPHSN